MNATKPPLITDKLQQAINKAVKKQTSKKTAKVAVDSEYQQCVYLAQYLEMLKDAGKIKAYTHLSQETPTISQRSRNNRMGLTPGFPDYFVITQRTAFLIEMKRVKGGVLSESQKEWIEHLRSVGLRTAVCKGYEQAKLFVDSQLM